MLNFGKKKEDRPLCAALILAAGQSSRMGLSDNQSKQFLLIDGMPILIHTLTAFQKSQDISHITVAARKEDFEIIKSLAGKYGITKLVNVIEGGSTRSQSSLHGILSLEGKCDYVAIHDGARPFISEKLIHDTFISAVKHKAAAPGIVPNDTIKRIDSSNSAVETPERSTLRMIQTPQIFEYSLIKRALLYSVSHNASITDDCSAVELLGKTVKITEGDRTNIKITSEEDMYICEMILRRLKNV